MTKQINEDSYAYDAEIVPIFAEGWLDNEDDESELERYRGKLLDGTTPKPCSSIDLTSFTNK